MLIILDYFLNIYNTMLTNWELCLNSRSMLTFLFSSPVGLVMICPHISTFPLWSVAPTAVQFSSFCSTFQICLTFAPHGGQSESCMVASSLIVNFLVYNQDQFEAREARRWTQDFINNLEHHFLELFPLWARPILPSSLGLSSFTQPENQGSI